LPEEEQVPTIRPIHFDDTGPDISLGETKSQCMGNWEFSDYFFKRIKNTRSAGSRIEVNRKVSSSYRIILDHILMFSILFLFWLKMVAGRYRNNLKNVFIAMGRLTGKGMFWSNKNARLSSRINIFVQRSLYRFDHRYK
jgi:hypothetical protein